MLCPCCGKEIAVAARDCDCGARFVGQPLDDAPIKVKRFAPVATATSILVIVACSVFIVTKWMAFAIALIIWSSWRAVKLARRDHDLYGGYRTAMTIFVIAIIAAGVAGGYGVTRIPKYFKNLETRRTAATQAAMFHVVSLLEEYKRVYGSYPRDEQEYKKAMSEALPADYWNKGIKYQSFTGALADGSILKTGLSFNNFELRSAGADGKEGTADDIIMRDGAFFTSAEIKKQPIVGNSSDR